MNTFKLIQTASLLVALTGIACAQWTVTSLHPLGFHFSAIRGATESSFAGYAVPVQGDNERAYLWTGISGAPVDLNPSLANQSIATDSSGSVQVGYARIAGVERASMWSGSASSWVDLHPLVATSSAVNATDGVKHVGSVWIDNVWRASLWTGSAATWTDLHPTGASRSEAFDVAGDVKVGYVQVGTTGFASLWSGSDGMWTNLHPQIAFATSSYARATSPTHQVGSVFIAGFPRASLWRGSAESWVSLDPSGQSSEALGLMGFNQVGYANVETVRHASLWAGTAQTWVDLHTYLTADYTNSVATSISTDGLFDYVAGNGFNGTSGKNEAIVWKHPVRKVSGNLVLRNTVLDGELGWETISWRLSSGPTAFEGSFLVNRLGGGAYSIRLPAGLQGSYTLRLKGGTFLSSAVTLNISGGNIVRNLNLRNGDIDQDGEVGPGDFEAVVGQFGGPGNADADNDGEVGPSDFEIVVGNFGLQDQ